MAKLHKQSHITTIIVAILQELYGFRNSTTTFSIQFNYILYCLCGFRYFLWNLKISAIPMWTFSCWNSENSCGGEFVSPNVVPYDLFKKKMLSPTNSSNSPIHPRIQDTGIWRIERPKGSFQRKGFWNSTNQRRNSRSSSSWHCCEKCPTHKAISSPVHGIRDGSRNFSQRRQRRIKTFDN